MNSLTNFIDRNITERKVWGLFILTNVVYLIMLLVTIPQIMEYAEGMKLLDMMPTGYDLEYVNSLFIRLGEVGRNFYLTRQIPIDMVYPFLFGLSYSLFLGYFLKKIQKLISPYSYLCGIPMIAGTADYLENLGIIIHLKSFPNLSSTWVSFTNFFSIAKSIATSAYFVILILVLITLVIKK